MYKQPVEHIAGRVHTQQYRIHGTLFPRPRVGMPDQLNRVDQPYLPIEEPQMFPADIGDLGGARPLVHGSFIAVPRESVLWVVGGEAGNADIRDFHYRDVAVLYGRVVIRGRLRAGAGMRTSDYIRNRVANKPFDALFDAVVSRLEGGGPLESLEAVERFPFLTVNLQLTTGVVELDAPPSEADEEGGQS